MKLKEYTIRLCRKDEYSRLIDFLHDHWSSRHVFCRDKVIFDFQHDTPGDDYNFVIAVHNDTGEIHAVLGYILPSTYDHRYEEVPEAVYGALWKVRDDVKNNEIGKLGLGVLSFLLKKYPESDYITLGLSSDSQAIYEALHFDFGKMNHYYIASADQIDFQLCKDPLISKCEANGEYELRYLEDVLEDFDPYYHPLKDKEYITNRYLKHPYYEYKLLGIIRNEEVLAIWVIRICKAQGSCCLRIVDMIGDISKIADISGNVQDFLKENGLEYADCYNYGIKKECFEKIGFQEVSGETIIPNYFEPFEKRNVDIHYAAYAKKPIVIFKGDGDQDRPNLLEDLR